MQSLDDTIRYLRSTPEYTDLVRDAFLGPDVEDSARRFYASGEYQEVKRLLGRALSGSTILDIGAGIGLASFSFARDGARVVFALEPDRSDLVGLGAMQPLITGLPVVPIQGFAEALPFPDAEFDIVYMRQVLHHTSDLKRALQESARVLRPGGLLLACREHVVKNEQELALFLRDHVVHQLSGGEHAYRLQEYTSAIQEAGLHIKHTFSTFDNVINYHPLTVHAAMENRQQLLFRSVPRGAQLLQRFPALAELLLRVMPVSYPGNMYTFWAEKNAR